jgi:hypothetical protein
VHLCGAAGHGELVKVRFVYFPTAEDPKGIARGFLLQAYPLYMPDGQLAPEGTPAEFFANENGLVLARKEFGTAREHIEPLLGLPKTASAQREVHFGQQPGD